MPTISMKDLPADVQAQLRGQGAPVNRMGNVHTVSNGIKYHSKAEAVRAGELDLMLETKSITHVSRQVSISLAGIIYRVDFMVFEEYGKVRFEEVKGHETIHWKIKRDLWKRLGPGPLYILKRKGRTWDIEVVEGKR